MKIKDYARRLLLPAAVAGLLVASLMAAVVLAADVTPGSEPAGPAPEAAASSAVGKGPAATGGRPSGSQLQTPRPSTELSPLDAVHLAWQRARDAAGYHFATDLAQVTFPPHTLAAAGSAADHTELYLEGAVDAQAETLDLKLWEGGGSVASPRAARKCAWPAGAPTAAVSTAAARGRRCPTSAAASRPAATPWPSWPASRTSGSWRR